MYGPCNTLASGVACVTRHAVRPGACGARAKPHLQHRRSRHRRAAGGAAGRRRHHYQHRHRPDPDGDHQRQRPLRGARAATRRSISCAGRDRRLRHAGAAEPGLQRRPERGAELRDAAVDRAGNGDGRGRCADRADHIVGGGQHHRSPGLREPAGQGAQLLPADDPRLERRRHRHGLERRQRRRPGSLELRHLRRRHQQPLEVADAAARAAARVERLRDRDGQVGAAHHQPVLGRVRRSLRRRGEHDHQGRHQPVQRLGVRDDPARRPGRGPAARADRQRREGQGAVQPAAVRRHRRRPDRQGQAVLLRQLRAASRAQRGDCHGRRGVGPGRADAGRRAPGPRQDRHALQRAAVARRPLQHGPLAQGQRGRRPRPAGHRLHVGQQRRHGARHVHDGDLRQDAQRDSRPVLALYRQPRREVRVRLGRAPGLFDLRRQRPGHLGRAARTDLRPVDHALDVDAAITP